MAVKKKSAAKKAVKKSPAKKTAAKKKAVAKKTTAKKAVAKKSPAKKRVAKKAVAKKTTTKRAVAKKSAVKKATASKPVAPVNVSTTPAPAAKSSSASAPKPSAAPRQGSSGKTLFAVLVAVVLLAAIVISNSGKDSDDSPAAEPAVTESAAPEASEPATEEVTPEAPAAIDPAAATGEAPSRFIGNWKDSSKSVMVITWKAPAGDVTGYTVETRANMGEWKVVSEVSPTTYSAEFAKTSTDGSTSFRVTAVYADGSYGVAPAFGFAGQFE